MEGGGDVSPLSEDEKSVNEKLTKNNLYKYDDLLIQTHYCKKTKQLFELTNKYLSHF